MRIKVAGEPYADFSVDGFIAGEADFDDQRRRCGLMYVNIDVGFEADGSMNLASTLFRADAFHRSIVAGRSARHWKTR
ncbi:hypothetical protein P9250_01165 [Caballeronia sp. LP006]|uniref:hypothetical protein n=1 Tax=Caballeronia sp. LP006 TaxID=3038552 RepID=UPI00285CC16C|nr:hypothetical protein [Caballeronia sp. LP006]MDR5826457.1 hypothetical protein [Caballeronia sp. LP006]